MMGPSHRLAGCLAGVSAASVAGETPPMVAMSGLIATATSHGWASPDVDQTGPWVKLRRALPSPLDKALNHRELSHWWGLPLLAWPGVTRLPAEAVWPALMLLVGWCSHLVGDLIFGDLPLVPGGTARVGLGLDTGGFWETGKVRLAGRRRTLVPFGPVRVLIVAGIVAVLVAPWVPDLPVRGAAHPTSQPSDRGTP